MTGDLLAVAILYFDKACMDPCSACFAGLHGQYLRNGAGLEQLRWQGHANRNLIASVPCVSTPGKGQTAVAQSDAVPFIRVQGVLLKGHNARERIQLAVEGLNQSGKQAVLI